MRHSSLIVVAGLVLGAASVASAEAPCSINTIRGTYALELRGQGFQGGISAVPGPGGLPLLEGTVLPLYFAGTFTVAADGSAVGSYAGLFGGVPVGVGDLAPWVASVTVHADCTGELVYPNAFGGTNVEKIVVLDNGREIRAIVVEGVEAAGVTWQTNAVRISRTDGLVPMCGPDTARGRYVMRCEGFEGTPGTPPVYGSVTPFFVFDIAADGTMTGRHFGAGHPLDGYATSGVVTVNPDCTMQILQQTDALPGATILAKGVYYDNGREWYGGPIVAFIGGTPVPGAFFGLGCHATRLTR